MTLAKRRGFFWNSNEIYGGSAGFYDYGPLGTRLECNLVDIWRDIFVIQEGYAEISTPVITPEMVFSASGHLKEFTDLMVECKKCSEPFRADQLLTEHHPQPDNLNAEEVNGMLTEFGIKCPVCGGALSEAYPFNLMFKTNIGPGSKRIGYLRPETAQGMFINFHLLYRYFREKIPFGVVQIGRAFRNEISPRQGMIRLREFKMAELEYFIDPSDKSHPKYERIKGLKIPLLPAGKPQEEAKPTTVAITLEEAIEKKILGSEVMAYFIGLTYEYLNSIGLSGPSLRFRQHGEKEKAHYAEDCWDAEILTSFGWIECVGIADRSCYDIERHNEYSGHTLAVTIHHEQPIEREVKKVIVDNKALGKKFKALSVKIKAALEKLDGNKVADDGSPLKVNIDGKDYEIDRDCFEVKTVTEKEFGKKIIPHVIEPSFGLDRITFALIENSYYERESSYRVLRFKPQVAPINAGVFPLMAKPELVEVTQKCIENLKNMKLNIFYDDSGSIGRRYARMDEAGTPFCVTIDYDSLKDNTVTIRERDSTDQVRIKIANLPKILNDLIEEKLIFKEIKAA
ncbi:MAG: glycine--tRNA ligase [Thermoplasmata archaeon]|nr:MAG: glycine--tRNA ligase [Thermoplasmata archaeon]